MDKALPIEEIHAYFIHLVLTTGSDHSADTIISYFEKHAIEVNYCVEGESPIIFAAARRNSNKLVEFFAQQGADLTLKDKAGHSLMDWAIHHKNDAMKKTIETYMHPPRVFGLGKG